MFNHKYLERPIEIVGMYLKVTPINLTIEYNRTYLEFSLLIIMLKAADT